MAQSDQRPFSVTERLENKIREFEEKQKWRVSLPARIIIQQSLISIFTDHIGLAEFTASPQQVSAREGAIDTLIPFLEDLATKGQALAEDAAKRDGRDIRELREIGAIYMLQNIHGWADKFCKCWPRG